MNGSTLKALHACIGGWMQSPNLARGCHVHASGLLINIVDLVSIFRICFGSISRSTMIWLGECIGWNSTKISIIGETFCSNYSNCPIVDGNLMSIKVAMLDFPIESNKEID
jgi:hypothetical protein